MDFLKKNRNFSAKTAGKSIWESDYSRCEKNCGDQLATEYVFPFGIKITNTARKFEKFGAYTWVNYFENISDTPSDILSEIWDCDTEIPLAPKPPRKWCAFVPNPEDTTTICAPNGSTWSAYEFYSAPPALTGFDGRIFNGDTLEFTNEGGRSSEGTAPFFDIHTPEGGVMVAVGWTGQWRARFTRTEKGVRIQTKIEDTYFKLLPKEKIRTSSVLIMTYDGSPADARNKWRKLLREHFSPFAKERRPDLPPFCAGIWGGMTSRSMLERVNAVKDNNLPFDCFWVDAGWYGTSKEPCPDEFVGDWGSYTGDWRVNTNIHPGGLADVSEAMHGSGRKFLLWFEPERVRKGVPIVSEHPEFFLECEETERDGNLLLNLGNEKAWQYCFETLSDIIERLKIDVYRQDFNFHPLPYWRAADAPDRRGISEIKHITGMYRLWDALSERFEGLLIDNCASGGRRIDIETLSRSVPLWRSDAQCPANYAPEISQIHAMTFGSLLPYSGTGTGREWGDLYRFRSAYSPGLTTNYSYAENQPFCKDARQTEWIRKYANEYLKVKPYLSEDIYLLTEPVDKLDAWAAVQYNDSESGNGVILAFRREKSPIVQMCFELGGIDKEKTYIFTDADSGFEFEANGKDLAENGFLMSIDEKRSSKLLFYRCI